MVDTPLIRFYLWGYLGGRLTSHDSSNWSLSGKKWPGQGEQHLPSRWNWYAKKCQFAFERQEHKNLKNAAASPNKNICKLYGNLHLICIKLSDEKSWNNKSPKQKEAQNWVVVSHIFYFHLYLGEIIQFDEHIFQRGWNHQLENMLLPRFLWIQFRSKNPGSRNLWAP